MKRGTLIAILTAVMIMACSVFSFAAEGLELVSSYPENGQKNTSMENLGVKLMFNHPINSEEAVKIDESKFSIVDEDGEKVKIYQNQHGKHTTVIIFSEEDGEASLVVIDGKLDMAQMMEQMSKEN